MPDWRDEVCQALDFWIAAEGGPNQAERQVCLGRARAESTPGWYAVDVRGSRTDVDQVESLRLRGKAGTGAEEVSYPVAEATQDGGLIRIRVAEFVDLDEAQLWQTKQPATYLLVKLREGIASMADAGLAHDLAAGRLTPPPDVVHPVAGFTPMQQEAIESCLTSGVRLVWGPPGTGKTRVLTEAIGKLVTTGKRVLLVSATNIAVDNALLGVVKAVQHKPGELLRVGPPHHPDVLKHPDICLPHLVRRQLAEVDGRRQLVEDGLLRLRAAAAELDRLTKTVAQLVDDFDQQRYRTVRGLLAAETTIPEHEAAVAAAEEASATAEREVDRLKEQVVAAETRVRRTAGARAAYAEIDRIQRELAELAAVTDGLHQQAVAARNVADRIGAELSQLESGGLLARLFDQARIRYQREASARAEHGAAQAQHISLESQERLRWQRTAALARIDQLGAEAGCRREEIGQAEAALTSARQAHAEASGRAGQVVRRLSDARRNLHTAQSRPRATDEDRAYVRHADEHRLPQAVTRLAELRDRAEGGKSERAELEKEHTAVLEEFERLRRDAEGEIIKRARMVATTLARLRTNKTLMEGPYDVVLIDEVGAANLPEVLLGVSRANRTAVLLGDFMQLGAVVSNAVQNANRADIQRWLGKDVFAHCGITTSGDAQGHPGCTALDVQHRFGPDVMGLANDIAYDGLLKAGPNIRAHAEDDPEIVLIDTDGLGDLARVRATGRRSGWWPAGALLSRLIIEYHRSRGEQTGVVTPYGHQVDATLEACRDQESSSGNVTEVGTAHRFQGREFPIVVFDLVEDDLDERWMARATLRGGSWERDGIRLFNVAVTRTKTRLYLIGSRTRINSAGDGNPMARVAALLRSRRARSVPATFLVTPTTVVESHRPLLGPFGHELSEILAEHVRVTDIHDERTFYEMFAGQLEAAQRSIWLWAPWTTKRVKSLLPVLSDATARGVKVVLFVRDPGDTLQGKPEHQQHLADLRKVVRTVVEINEMHQKIVVIDEERVLLGSLNSLSQSRTREVMLAVRGAHFARKLLEHENAATFAQPPRCGACNGSQVDLRRRRSGEWYWRCYAPTCPRWSSRGRTAWVQRALPGAGSPTAARTGRPAAKRVAGGPAAHGQRSGPRRSP
ncbi:AAA domain-containing protein [Polymorphospora rubra]|uniref:AAA domain-containing protein n=1 Tax=Polymorphospora rubra TaxID=338584 RepID=UPI0034074395